MEHYAALVVDPPDEAQHQLKPTPMGSEPLCSCTPAPVAIILYGIPPAWGDVLKLEEMEAW